MENENITEADLYDQEREDYYLGRYELRDCE